MVTSVKKRIVTPKNNNPVIMDEAYLRNLEETNYLYGIPEMRQNIIEGINTPLSECEEIDWKSDNV